MVVPAHGRAGDLDALLDGEINGAVRNNDIAALAERGDDRRDSRKALGVQNGRLCTQEIGDVIFELHVDVCCESIHC